MPSILVLGAGRSSSALIDYLLQRATEFDWNIVVGDISLANAKERVKNFNRGTAVAFDIQQESSHQYLQTSDVVISLLPAALHPRVAKRCLEFKKHLLTASYVSDEMKSFDREAKQKGLLFLNECGLDPGLDHMSAMQVIERIKDDGGDIYSFESFTGGLIAPDTDSENPWRYKFTWNPRNVVLAGQGTAKFLQDGQFKEIPYKQLFKQTTPVTVPGYGEFEGYANRDSLTYRDTYGLQKIKTMLRGTLRNKGFCSAWDIFVQMGCTDDSYPMKDVANMTHAAFFNSFLEAKVVGSLEKKIERAFKLKSDSPEMLKLKWSGLFENIPVGLKEGTPAQILEHILNKRWKLEPQDRDMIVMWHRFRFWQKGREKEIQASLVVLGENSIQTAMAKTVGLPLAIAAKLLLREKIKERGVMIPVIKEIYLPVLDELRELGIFLQESVID